MIAAEIFSAEWLNDWKNAINTGEYREAGKNWNAPLLLKFSDSSGIAGFYLDLQSGTCREIRFAADGDFQLTETVLTAPRETWLKTIRERKDPLFMLMQGAIRLEKGSLVKLASHRKGAQMLLKAASDISNGTASQETKKESVTGEDPETSTKNFVSTGRGLDLDSFPMQLFQKSKKLGVWDPAAISFEEDARQWKGFNDTEKTVLLHLSSMFMGGEEAVTRDLLPLINAVSHEGRIEEEIYLTSFLWEEAKHTEFFSLFLRKVAGSPVDLERFHGKAYTQLFCQELPTALRRLETEPTPENQLLASLTYNMIVEGTLAETGYEAYFRMLTKNNLLPGLREGIGLLKRDESRHIAYGLFLIDRLLREHPHLRDIFEAEAGRLISLVVEIVHEMFDPYPVMPFGLKKEDYLEYASDQFRKRMQKLNEDGSER